MINPIALATTTGFDAEFTKLIAQPGTTHLSAYQQLEDIYEQRYGRPRYASYDSYRLARRKRMQGS